MLTLKNIKKSYTTGDFTKIALDTKTSVQIMELTKDIFKDKLVIMVTNNPELAHDYADRI